jgi:hypothetical protein
MSNLPNPVESTCLRVTCDGKEIGRLYFEEANGTTKLVRGQGRVSKSIGNKRMSDVVILAIYGQFSKHYAQCGRFPYKGFVFGFICTEMESQLKKAG